MANKKQVERDFAKILFVNENISQKEIALRLNVTEKTIGKWVKEGDWDSLKISMLVTKDNQLTSLYKQLENINREIMERPIIRDVPAFLLKPVKIKNGDGSESLEFPKYDEKDYPIKIGNVANSKDADIISKLTSSINKLETETNIGETVEVAKQLIQFIAGQDLAFSKTLTEYCDAFITAKMKR